MTSLSWFRRFRTELSAPRVSTRCDKSMIDCNKLPKFAPIATLSMLKLTRRSFNEDVLSMVLAKTYKAAPLLRYRISDIRLQRFYHASAPAFDPVRTQSVIDFARLGYVYLEPNAMNEKGRSNLKYVTSKLQVTDPPAPDLSKSTNSVSKSKSTSRPRSVDKTPGSTRSISATSSHSGVSTTSTQQSVSEARHETAREFVNPNLQLGAIRWPTSEKISKMSKVMCPKPNYNSPYSRVTVDDDQEGTSLRTHYDKVMKKPDRHLGVLIPRQFKQMSIEPRFKPRKFDQYYLSDQNLTNKSPMSHQEMGQRNFNNYHHIKRDSQTCVSICGSGQLAKNGRGLKKRVDVVKMEVVRLGKSLRHSHNSTDINRQLKHVLKEALAQNKKQQFVIPVNLESCKVASNNVCLANPLPSPQPIAENVKTMAPSLQNNDGSMVSDASCFEMKKETPHFISHQPDCDCLYPKTDGKHCYNILNGKPHIRPVDEKKVDGMKSNAIDSTLSITDLTLYDSGFDTFANLPQIGLGPNDLQEMDFKIAKNQHKQHLRDVFDKVNRIKVN